MFWNVYDERVLNLGALRAAPWTDSERCVSCSGPWHCWRLARVVVGAGASVVVSGLPIKSRLGGYGVLLPWGSLHVPLLSCRGDFSLHPLPN